MTDNFDLDALLEEAATGTTNTGTYEDDYVTSSKKSGELVPAGKHDVYIGHVGTFGTTDWGTESVSLVLKMQDSNRGWWANLDFAVAGDSDRTDKSITATLKKLIAIGFTKEEAKDLVRNRKTANWEQVLKDMKLNVTVKHNDASGHTYANTYFNKRLDAASTPTDGNPMPAGLPSLGN